MPLRPTALTELFVPLSDGESLQAQLYRRLRQGIVSGEFAAGTRLPSTRTLASRLRISRTTTQIVYDQLGAEGYLETRTGSGTFVCKSAEPIVRIALRRPSVARPVSLSRHARRIARTRGRWSELAAGAPRQPIHFHPGVPDTRLFPHRAWSRLVAECVPAPGPFARDHPHVLGAPELRQVLARHLATTRGVQCDPEQIVIVSGTHQGLGLLTRIVADPGDLAVVEDPCYLGAAAVLAAEGLRVVPIRVDQHGLDTTALQRLRSGKPRLVYVTPSHHFPTGVAMSYPRRRTLLGWAKSQGATIFEEDYHAEFRVHGRPIESLYALDDAGCVVHAGTFAKSMAPSIRIGYLVLPRALIEPVSHAKWLSDFGASPLEQVALARFIGRGDFARHLRRCRTTYWKRREVLLSAARKHLPQAQLRGDDAGLHMLADFTELPARATQALLQAAAREGVGVTSAHIFYATPPRHAQLLLGYACLDEQEIESGVRRLARALRTLELREYCLT